MELLVATNLLLLLLLRHNNPCRFRCGTSFYFPTESTVWPGLRQCGVWAFQHPCLSTPSFRQLQYPPQVRSTPYSTPEIFYSIFLGKGAVWSICACLDYIQ